MLEDNLMLPVIYSIAERKSTVGIECGKWECGLKGRGAPRGAPKITFYTWDFAGQVVVCIIAYYNRTFIQVTSTMTFSVPIACSASSLM